MPASREIRTDYPEIDLHPLPQFEKHNQVTGVEIFFYKLQVVKARN